MTSCTRVMLATGAMSRLRLKLSFSYIVVLIARARDRLGGDIAASTRPVLDDEWLAKAFRQPLAHQTCDDVESAALNEDGGGKLAGGVRACKRAAQLRLRTH